MFFRKILFLPLLCFSFSCGVMRAEGDRVVRQEDGVVAQENSFKPVTLFLSFQKKLEEYGYAADCISECLWGLGQGAFSAFLEQQIPAWHSEQGDGAMRQTGGLGFYYFNSNSMSLPERIVGSIPLFFLKQAAFDGGKALMITFLQQLQCESL